MTKPMPPTDGPFKPFRLPVLKSPVDRLRKAVKKSAVRSNPAATLQIDPHFLEHTTALKPVPPGAPPVFLSPSAPLLQIWGEGVRTLMRGAFREVKYTFQHLPLKDGDASDASRFFSDLFDTFLSDLSADAKRGRSAILFDANKEMSEELSRRLLRQFPIRLDDVGKFKKEILDCLEKAREHKNLPSNVWGRLVWTKGVGWWVEHSDEYEDYLADAAPTLRPDADDGVPVRIR